MTTSLDDALNGKVNEETKAPEMEVEAVEVQDEPETVEATQEAVEADEQPEPEKPDTKRARDAKGKFAKKDKSEPSEGEGSWSYHAYKDEKEKRQALEKRLAEAEAARPPQQAQQAPAPPDPIDDPNAYTAHMQQQLNQQLVNERLNVSEVIARQQHGDEVVQAAQEAFKVADIATKQRVMASPNPYGELVQWHNKQQAMADIGDDPQAFRERVRAEIMAEMEAQQSDVQAQPAQPSQPIPANFAGARNAGQRKGPQWSGPTSLDAALGQVRT